MRKTISMAIVATTMISLCYAESIKTYTFENKKFTIDCPKSCRVSELSDNMVSILLPTGKSKVKYRPSIAISSGVNSAPKSDLDAFVVMIIGKILQYPNGTLIESNRIQLGDQEAHQLLFTREQSGVTIAYLEGCIVTPERAYVLLYGADSEDFDNHVDMAIDIMNSFKAL